MVIIKSGERFSCEACIRGHRIATCSHKDRVLKPVKSRGRPTSQCNTCRNNRKSLGKHVKCQCAAQIDDGSDLESRKVMAKGKEKEIVGMATPRTLDTTDQAPPNVNSHPKCKCEEPLQSCICCENEVQSTRRPARRSPHLTSSKSSTATSNKRRKLNLGAESIEAGSRPVLSSENISQEVPIQSSSTQVVQSVPPFSPQKSQPRSSCCSSSTSTAIANAASSSPQTSTPTSSQALHSVSTFNAHSSGPTRNSNSLDRETSTSSAHLFLLSGIDPSIPFDSESRILGDSDTSLTSSHHQQHQSQAHNPNPNPDSLESLMDQARSETDCNCGSDCRCPGCFGLKKENGRMGEKGYEKGLKEKIQDGQHQADEEDLEEDATPSRDFSAISSHQIMNPGNDSSFEYKQTKASIDQTSSTTLKIDDDQLSQPLPSTLILNGSDTKVEKDGGSSTSQASKKDAEFFDGCPTLCQTCKGCDLSLENPWFGIPEVDDFMANSRANRITLDV